MHAVSEPGTVSIGCAGSEEGAVKCTWVCRLSCFTQHIQIAPTFPHQQFPRSPCRMSEGLGVRNTDHLTMRSLKTLQLISCGLSHCFTRCWTLSPSGKPTDWGPGGKLSSTKLTWFCVETSTAFRKAPLRAENLLLAKAGIGAQHRCREPSRHFEARNTQIPWKADDAPTVFKSQKLPVSKSTSRWSCSSVGKLSLERSHILHKKGLSPPPNRDI